MISKAKRVALLALLVSTLTVGTALGQTADDGPDASTEIPAWLSQRGKNREANLGAEAQGASPWRGLLVLVLVGGLGGTALYLRKRQLASGKAPAMPSTIRVVASARLSPKAQAVIATVGGRTILLGVTDQSVRKLAWLDAGEAEKPAPELVVEQADYATLNAEGRPIAAVARTVSPEGPRAALAAERFNDMLKTELERPAKATPKRGASAAETLAAATEDVFLRSSATNPRGEGRRRHNTALVATEQVAPAPRASAGYEGQIAGLSARLQGKVA